MQDLVFWCPWHQHTSNTTQGTHLGVGSIGDTARCMVMGLVKYTRYPEQTGHGIKIMKQGVDYSGVVQLKWPGFPVYQRQGAGFSSTTLSDYKLKADNHIVSTQLSANPLQSMGFLRCFSQKHNFRWLIAVREKTGKENEQMHAHVFTLHPNWQSTVTPEVRQCLAMKRNHCSLYNSLLQ